MNKKIHYRLKRRTVTQSMLDKGISIKEYAKKYNYTVDGVRYLIATRKVICFKFGRGLYIVDASPLISK